MKIIHEATKVKKAFLIEGENFYELQYYDTIILKFTHDRQLVFALKCSPTSTKAIHQVCDYFKMNFDEVKKSMTPYSDFYKYDYGARG